MRYRTLRAPPIHRDVRGVTVVEVAVVVGLVLLLAAVALTSVSGIRHRQRSSACKAELTKVTTAVEAFEALPAAQNPSRSPPANMAVLKFSGLLDGKVGSYVTYTRVRSGGHWVPRYANGPKGNCAPD
jgi:Tfp pilus assembly protein PilE